MPPCIFINKSLCFSFLSLQPLTTPVSASSKVVQLLAILRAKDSQSISAMTWVISAFTNLSKSFLLFFLHASEVATFYSNYDVIQVFMAIICTVSKI
jgi:hypothetical protein